ncbi:MAG: glycosyltransferase family 4 protein, partial [Candidatus Hodarchaeota archaeon]
MNIIHLISYFQPKIGYQETFLCREQITIGHEVSVVTSERFYPFPSYTKTSSKILGNRIQSYGFFIEEGIPTIRLPIFFEIGTQVMLRDLSKIVEKIDPEIIHLHSLFSFNFFSFLFKKINTPLIIDVHHQPFREFHEKSLFQFRLKKAYFQFIKPFFRKYLNKNKIHITAATEEAKMWLVNDFKLPKEQVHHIPLGADIDRFNFSLIDRINTRKELGFHKMDVIFVYAGKIIPQKGLESVIFSSQLLPRTLDYRLLFIGNGEPSYVYSLKKLAKKLGIYQRLIFLEAVPNNQLSRFFSASDVGIWLGSPSNSIQEAMANNLPVLLSKKALTNKIDKAGGILIVEDDNFSAIASIMEDFCYDDEKRLMFGRLNRSFTETHFNW